jgi:hypothetical protein
MDPTRPLFYTSTFVTNQAAGLMPNYDLSTVAGARAAACFGSGADGARCAALSQMVGRITQQNTCSVFGPTMVPSVSAAGADILAQQAAAGTSILAALSAVGSTNQNVKTCLN